MPFNSGSDPQFVNSTLQKKELRLEMGSFIYFILTECLPLTWEYLSVPSQNFILIWGLSIKQLQVIDQLW